MIDLLINDKDALAVFGVRMGEGFKDIIDDFPTMKPYIINESRNEDGVRISITNPKESSRQVNLPFTIEGSTEIDYQTKKNLFITELKKGLITISVPPLGANVYKLVYLGKGTSYALSVDRTFSKFVLKFEESNPADRK